MLTATKIYFNAIVAYSMFYQKGKNVIFYVHVLSWEKMAALGPWGPGAITNSASQWCNMLNNSLINQNYSLYIYNE